MDVVSAHYLYKIYDSLLSLGIGKEAMLEMIPGAEPALKDPLGSFDCELVAEILRMAEAQTGDPAIAFRCGLGLREHSYDDYAYAMFCSENLGELFHITSRYSKLSQQLGYFTNERDDKKSTTVWHADNRDPEDWRLVTDLALSSIVRTGLLIKVIHLVEVFEVTVRHENTSYRDLYKNSFGCDITYGHELDSVTSSVEFFNFPLPSRNPALKDVLVDNLERRLKMFDQPITDVMRVEAHLNELLGQEPPMLDTVADRLGIGERTLRRKLKQAGTSFSEILVDVRRHRYRLLKSQDKYSDAQIAVDLGYSEQSAFVRARKSWNLPE